MCTAMAVSGHLLILLIPVLSLCGATEYYVRPTEPTNTSCPAQPCLTLNQYVNDSDYYFQSNTVFKFLPGTHHMDRPVTIGNVHNMSLENFSSERPYLVAQFSCKTEVRVCIPVSAWIYHFDVCCAAIWLHDVHNVTIRGVIVTVKTPNVSGVILTNVSNVKVHFITTYSSYDHYCLGIAIRNLLYEADSVEVQSSSVNNCTLGLMLESATNSHISDITATYNMLGVVLVWIRNSHISDITATYNMLGVVLVWIRNSHISNTIVTHNSFEGMYLGNTNNIHLTNTTAAYSFGYGMHLWNMSNTYISYTTTPHNGEAGMLLDTMNNVYITSTTFTDINAPNSATVTAATMAADPNMMPAIIVLHQSTLNISECHFTGNHISAIKGLASNITVYGNLTFSGNRAFAGTAFILSQDSVLSLAENSHIYFLDNHAANIGGVFYIITSMKYYSNNDALLKNTNCFLHVGGGRSQKRLTFVNNSAEYGGDILYGGEVALGFDGQWNCLDSFKNISNISQNGFSLISSDPSRVCLCNETGQPDCLTIADPTPHSIYPGQSISIPAVVVGQDFGTVAGSVYAKFLPNSSSRSLPLIESWQKVQAVTQQNCSNLHYTILPQSDIPETTLTVLVLTAHNNFVLKFINNVNTNYWQLGSPLYRNNPVYINISLLPCPPGFMLTTRPPFTCDCDLLLQQMQVIQCYIQDQTIGRSGLLWVGTIQDHNKSNKTIAASEYCSLNYCNIRQSNVTLSEPDSQCNYNHSGTLCGGCQPGLSLALGSAQCLPCSNKYLALLIPFTLAGLLLVGVIKLLDLTISQGTMNGLIFYVNIVKGNEYVFLPQGQTNPLTVFIAWLNLDLGVKTCFFSGLSAYSKTWLQFVFPLYIWSIAGLIIILAKYSDRVAKVMGNNSVPVLATLILLSYAKIFRTIITALSYTVVYTSHSHKAVWTADGNVDYLSPKHAPLFAVAVFILLFVWLPYTLLLFLGQWLHMCNCQVVSQLLIKIKPFLDAHYGPLKSKHRYWFGALLLVRAVILLIQALVPTDRSSTVVFCILVSAIVLTYYGQLVYNKCTLSVFNTAFYMNLALLSGASFFANAVGEDLIVATYVLIGIAFVQFVGLAIFKVFSILKQNKRIMTCLHKRQPLEEDWEVYEQAVHLREIESDAEEEGSEGSGSMESLPTY